MEGGSNSCELFKSVKMSEGKKSLAMVCSVACNEKVGSKRPGADSAGGAAPKKEKA